MPARPATTSDLCGTPAARVCFAVRTTVTMAPEASSTAQIANTSQAAGVPVTTAQTSTASPIRIEPGSTGMTIPTRPDENGQPNEKFQHDSVLQLHDDVQ